MIDQPIKGNTGFKSQMNYDKGRQLTLLQVAVAIVVSISLLLAWSQVEVFGETIRDHEESVILNVSGYAQGNGSVERNAIEHLSETSELVLMFVGLLLINTGLVYLFPVVGAAFMISSISVWTLATYVAISNYNLYIPGAVFIAVASVHFLIGIAVYASTIALRELEHYKRILNAD